MTDCIHNDKRTCFHERLEMNAEIEKLKAEKNILQNTVTILRWEIETLKNPDAVNR